MEGAALLVLIVAGWFLLSKRGQPVAVQTANPGASPQQPQSSDAGTAPMAGNDVLANIVQAINRMEGGKPGNLNVRNNNPGNLRSDPGQVGTNDGFAVFANMDDGYEALSQWITRHAAAHPDWTFYDLFNVYAPSSDNNKPNQYAEFVASQAGVDPSQTVSSVLNEGNG
jgi:hypothetical protein